MTLQPLDYLAIAVYMSMMAVIGVALAGLIKDVAVYFKAGGTLPWAAAAVSNYMSMFSAFIFVAYAGMAYEYGLVALTVIWCTVPPALAAVALLAHRWRRAGIMTPTEYLETRFNSPVRQVLSWGGIGFRVLDNMVRLYAIGIFLAKATPLSLPMSILLSGLIVTLYTVAGGLWAVVLTDAVQFVVLVLAALIMLPLSVQAAGGLNHMVETLPEHFSLVNGPKGAPLFLAAYYLMVLIKYNGNWSFIQRFYSVRDEAAARKAGLLMAAFFFVFPIVYLLPAVAARIVEPGLENPEMAYVAMALRLLPQGVMGLMIAAMFAATMSALDSDFNITAGVFTRDIYQRILRPTASDRELMWAARGATVVIGMAAVAGALFVDRFGGAFEANKVLTGLAIPLSVPLVLGILLRRARPWSALASLIVGIVTGAVLVYHPEVSWPVATLSVIGISVAIMLVSCLFPSRDADYRRRVAEFFERLATPIAEDEKPQPDPAFQRSLTLMLAASLGCAGLLFTAMGLVSIADPAGLLAVVAGVTCLLLSGGCLIVVRRKHDTTTTKSQ